MKKILCLIGAAACGPTASRTVGPTLPMHRPVDVATSQPVDEPKGPTDHWAGRKDLIAPPPSAAPAPVALPPIDRFTLPNGLRVLVIANHDLPIVSWELAIKVGSEDEPRDKRGVASLAANLLTKGTPKHSADQISQLVDSVGGTLAAAADLEATHVSCAVLTKDQGVCGQLVPEIVAASTFADAELATAASQRKAELALVRDDAGALAAMHFANALWGEDHARGWPETPDTVGSVTHKDVAAFAASWYRPSNAVLAIAGDVDAAKLKSDLTKAFAGWQDAKVPAHATFADPTVSGVHIRLVNKPDQTQSQIILGSLGVTQKDPDFVATLVANEVLGGPGSFSSRLMRAVRWKAGKTYDAKSHLEALATRGSFTATTATQNPQTGATLELVRREIKKLASDGPTDSELADAKSSLAGAYPLGFQSASDVARAVVAADLHGLGDDWVRDFPLKVGAVTMDDVKAAAKKHLDADDLVVVIVGKADDVIPQLTAAQLNFGVVDWKDPVSKKDRDAKVAAQSAPADPKRTADGLKLVDQALAAVGGVAKVKAIKDLTGKGKIHASLAGHALEGSLVEWLDGTTGSLRIDITVPQGTMTMVAGEKGGFQKQGTMTQDMSAADLVDARGQVWRDMPELLLRARDTGAIVQANPKATVAGKDYDSVTIRAAGGYEATLLLDTQTHLPWRVLFTASGATSYEELSDWRTQDGLALPFARHDDIGQPLDITFTEIKVNAGVPAGTFAK